MTSRGMQPFKTEDTVSSMNILLQSGGRCRMCIDLVYHSRAHMVKGLHPGLVFLECR